MVCSSLEETLVYHVPNNMRRDSSRRGITGISSRRPCNDEHMMGEGAAADATAVFGLCSKGEGRTEGSEHFVWRLPGARFSREQSGGNVQT